MAQTMLVEALRQYHILPLNAPDMIDLNDELMEDFEVIPQGIPALYEYSARFARDRRAKKMVDVFINLAARHRGCLLVIPLVPLAFVVVYVSRPMISSVLSSILENSGRITEGTAPKPYQPSYTTKATQTSAPIPDLSAEADSELETVTLTVAEMLWIKEITTDLLENQEKSKIRQADMLTAIGDMEEENGSLRDEVTRLQMKIQGLENQHALDENNQRKLFNERESYRLGGKNFKEKWEKLQKEYNDLEDDHDECGVIVDKLRDELNDMTVQRDELKQANGLLKIENEELEANAATDKEAAVEYEEACEELNNDVSRQARELQEAAKETADLKAQLAAVQTTGSQVDVKEDTSRPSTQPVTIEQSKMEMRKLKKELDELKAVQNTSDPSRDSGRGPIFEQPQGLSDDNIEEGAPLRRVQSAPLWLPLPHRDDGLDSLFDGSDYGDDDDGFDSLFEGSDYGYDDDHDDDEGQGDQDNSHDPANDDGNGSHKDEHDDDDEDDHVSGDDNVNGSDQHQNDENDHVSGDDSRGRSGQDENNDDADDQGDGGAGKIALQAYQTQQDQVGATTPLPEDIPLPDTPPNDGQVPIVPEPSPRRASPSLNVAAPVFVPAHHQTPPVPFRAMGPQDTKNDHVKEINVGLKRQTWAEKSGKPDLVEGKEGAAVAEDVIDDMYDRQITQYLNFKPIECARGSMWGALNDVPHRLEDVSTPTKKEDDANEAFPVIQQNLDSHSSGSQDGVEEHDEDDGGWSDFEDQDREENDGVTPMMGNYKVTRGPKDGQKDDATPMLGSYKVTHGPKPINHSSKEIQKKPTGNTQKSNRSITPAHCKPEAPQDEEESEAAGDWTDVEDGTDKEIQDEDSPEENGGTPMLGNYKVTRGDTPSDSDHEISGVENESGHDSSPPMACETSAQEMSRQDVTTPDRASQFVGSSRSDSDATNQVGDAAESRAPPQDVTTPVRVPQFAGQPTSDSDATNQPDATAVSQAPPDSSSTPTTVPKPQPPPNSPTGPRAKTSHNPLPAPSNSNPQTPLQPSNPNTTPKVHLPTPRQCGIDNQDPTPIVRLPRTPIQNQTKPAPVTPSTRTSTPEELDSNTSSQRAIFRQPPRPSEPSSTPANPGSPPRDGSAASPFRNDNSGMQNGNRTPPTGPAAGVPNRSRGNASGGRGGRGAPALGSGTQSPGFNVRNGNGGAGQQQGPVRGPVPRGPAAANTTNNTPSRQSGRGRGSGSAADSFQRFQERMAREKGS